MTFAVAPGGWVRETVSSGGYPALAGLILAENLFPPIPSELILPLAGYYVGQGEMTFVLAVLAATLGSLAGALLLYAIARFGGRKVVLRFGKVLRMKERDLDKADEWFDRHGAWVVLGGRLVPGARSLVSIPAGLSEMPLVKFTALTALGSTAWNALLIGAGWALGEHYEKVGGVVGPISTAVVGVCALAVLGLVLVALRRRRRPA
jgi:membrane protein DedA with SNARE-associated domain